MAVLKCKIKQIAFSVFSACPMKPLFSLFHRGASVVQTIFGQDLQD